MTAALIQARNYTRGPRHSSIDLIVIHTMENDEKPDGAENVARWFAGPTAPEASAHYCIDSNSIVQCVKDDDIAWAAPGANHNGLHFEHAGRAAQGKRGWADPYSTAMLHLSAELAAEKCQRYGIPILWLSPSDLLAGRRGITSHANVSLAFHKSDHTDPGPTFPAGDYLALIRANISAKLGLRNRTGYYAWAAWKLGVGAWKPYGPANPKVRPNVPRRVPLAWWPRYAKQLATHNRKESQ